MIFRTISFPSKRDLHWLMLREFPAAELATQWPWRQVFDIGHDSEEDDIGPISSAVRALNVDSVEGRWAQVGFFGYLWVPVTPKNWMAKVDQMDELGCRKPLRGLYGYICIYGWTLLPSLCIIIMWINYDELGEVSDFFLRFSGCIFHVFHGI